MGDCKSKSGCQQSQQRGDCEKEKRRKMRGEGDIQSSKQMVGIQCQLSSVGLWTFPRIFPLITILGNREGREGPKRGARKARCLNIAAEET